MKKSIFILSILSISSLMFGQLNWRKSLNGPPGGPPTIGTDATWNSQFQIQTNALDRIWVHHRGPGPIQNYPGALLNPLPGNRLTRIGISRDGQAPVTTPLSLLHLGYNWPLPGLAGGFRSWQDIGTMYGAQTDNFYVGLRQKNAFDPTGRGSSTTLNPTDANDAVITWGDNFPLNGPAPDDNLTFIFHSPLGAGPPSPFNAPYSGSDYGREVLRLTGLGNVGVGPVFYDNAQPQNILHVNNYSTTAAYVQISNAQATGQTATDGFQLGITQFPIAFGGAVAEVRNYENTDMRFYTDNIQRMVIKNSLPGNFGRVGIRINTPGNRLEINSDPINDPYGPQIPVNGASGLKFTNLNSTKTPLANPGAGVLSVDLNGNVIYVPAAPLGAPCPANAAQIAAAQLTVNRQLPLNGFNFIYSGLGRVGIGTPCVPNNKLEVDAGTGVSPISGLRLTQLGGAPPLPSNGQVLSVNLGGDVILTAAPAGGGVGGYCPNNPSHNLTGDYEVPLAGFRYYFPGQNPAANNQDIVSVGYNCGSNPPARFSVLEAQTPAPNISTYAGHFQNNDLTTTANNQVIGGVYGEAKGNVAAPSPNSQINVGGVFEGNNSWSSIGVMGRTLPTTIPAPLAGPSRYAMGGAFMSQGTLTNTNLPPAISNYGVWAKAANAPVSNIGVYAESVPDPNGIATGYAVFANAGINHNSGTGGDWAGYFDGDVYTTSAGYYTSDKNLKKDINKMQNSMDIINKLNPVTFNFDKEGNKQMNLASGLQYGFISQEVKEILPQFTKTVIRPAVNDADGNELAPKKEILSLNYQGFIAILTKGMQEQQTQIEEQKKANDNQQKQIDELKAMIHAMTSNNGETKLNNSQAVELSDKNAIVLNQNVPNPFAESTTINYNIPTDFTKAQIIFSTSEGKIIKTVDVIVKGRGTLNVFANDLSSGMYTYTLVVDGKTIDTKKMVKD